MIKYSRIIKNCLVFLLGIAILYFSVKLSIFYLPFLIGYVISVLIEPLISFVKKHTNFTRKTSSIIVLILVFSILIGLLSWGIIVLFNEVSNFLGDMNYYFDKIMSISNFVMEKLSQFHFPENINSILQNNLTDILGSISSWIKGYLNNILKSISSAPKIFIYAVITILATFFISSDKFYILDRLEHHIPKKWVGKLRVHLADIMGTLGQYLKAEATLVLISFVTVTIGLHILFFMGMKISYPLLMAVFIGFVDALPILGAGTVFIPWIFIEFINSNNGLALSLLGIYFLTIVLRQLLEPKLVSKGIGIHPIFTLIAMYTGFKLIGILGLLIGPIFLVVLKNIFASNIDRGIVKSIFD